MAATERHGTKSFAHRAAQQVMQVVTFRIGAERYAAPIAQVREVIACTGIARAFDMPPEVVGIFNLRGEIIPIIALDRRLGVTEASPAAVARERQILVCRIHGSVVGFIVDEVLQVAKLARQTIQPPPAGLVAGCPDRILGLCPRPEGLLTIIDLAADHVDPAPSLTPTATPTLPEG